MRVSGVSCVVLYSGDAGQMRQIGHETHQHCPQLTDQQLLLLCIAKEQCSRITGKVYKKKIK